MKTQLLTIFILIFLFSCSSNESHIKTKSHTSVTTLPAPGTRMTNEFKDIDTVINLSFFKLYPYATKISEARKKNLIVHALKSANIEQTELYKLKDFYLIDLDNDKDLDLIYSSNISQYKLMDGNFILILGNHNGIYKPYRITGFLYGADFSKKLSGQIILKTVNRPCCDYFNYNFFETNFDTKSWTLNIIHVLEIHQSKVHEEKITAKKNDYTL